MEATKREVLLKTSLRYLVIGWLGGLGLSALTAQANLEVSAGVSVHATADFYAPLATSGAWLTVGSYGRCWRPAGVAVGWRPYCSGHWVWTDCGWYWASAEPWAWACYHYGCWVYDPAQAWVWVPGIEWAPAWVSWRTGGGYIGWAPLGPPGVRPGVSSFVFVDTASFQKPVRPATVIVNNALILKNTTVINNLKRETRNLAGVGPRQVVVNPGPKLAMIQQVSRTTIKPLPIADAARMAPAPTLSPHRDPEIKPGNKAVLVPVEPPRRVPEQKAPAVERPNPPVERPNPPVERPNPPAKSPPPGRDRPPPTSGPAPSPHAGPAPARPPGSAPETPGGPGQGKEHEPEGDHHGRE